MAGLYDRLATVINNVVGSLGRQSIVLYVPSSTYTAGSPELGAGDESTWPKATVNAFVSSFQQQDIDGDRIRATDVMLLIAASDAGWGSLSPSDVSLADIDGERYSVSLVKDIKPGPVSLAIIMRARR